MADRDKEHIVTTLGQLVASHWSGYSFRSSDYSDSGIPVLTKGDIKPRGIVEHGWRYVPTDFVAKHSVRLTDESDLLVSTRDLTTAANFLGLVSKAPSTPHAVSQGVTVFRVKDDVVDKRYLSYWCESPAFRGHIKGHYVGATQIHIRHTDLMAAPVVLPRLPEQRRIASVLSAYDDLIENNTRRITILDEMARRIYEEWFVHFRFPGHEQVRMVESELGKIPKGWEAASVESVSDYINRGLTPKYDESADGIVINQKCIRDKRLNYELVRRQSKPVSDDKRVRYGDVLINSTGVGTLGRVAQVLEERPNCTVDTHITIVRPSNSVTTHFFGMALLSLEHYFEQQGVGATGQTELGRGRVAETQLCLPPYDLQDRFDKIVAPMRSLVIKLGAKNLNLRMTRDLLLPKLISGELYVSNLPEPEEAIAA